MSLDEHDSWSQRKTQLAQQDQVSDNSAYNSSLRSSIDISNRVDQPSNDGHNSNHGDGDGEVNTSNKVHDQAWGCELEEVVVCSLGVVELVPLLVGKLVRIATISHVRVSALLHLHSCCWLVLISEVRLHEVFSEDFSSDLTGEQEANEEYFECDEDSYEQDVAVFIG